MSFKSILKVHVLAGSVLLSVPVWSAQVADQIWMGGPVLTMNDRQPTAEAVAIKDGRILDVGTLQAMQAYKGTGTNTIDLQGKALLPGFVDAHGHAFMIGVQAMSANLLAAPDGQVKDIKSLQETLKQWLDEQSQTRQVGLILGFGYDDAQLAEQRHPTRHDLDAVSESLPIVIIHQSSHIGVLNSKALEMAGITAQTPNPEGGVIRREEGSQQPNGVLEEMAFFSGVASQMGKLTPEQAQALFVAGTDLLKRYGYTTGQEGRATSSIVPLMQAAAKAGKIDIDVATYVDILQDRDFILRNASREYTDGFRVAGAKLTIDGSPQGFTAYRDRPYYNPPAGYRADYRGYVAATPDQVFESVDWAFKNGIQILTHSNGEGASDLLLAAIKTAREKYGPQDRRAVLIHGQFLRRDQVATIAELDVFPSLFPMHTFYWGDWHRDRTVGPVNADNISPTGWVREHGLMFSSHHDAPVAFPNSMRVLSATVTRRSRSGDILGPDQRVDVPTALKAMTIWPAYQHFEEKEKGSIEPGKLADFVVLSQDPTAVDPEQLSTLEVIQTIKRGKLIYEQGAASEGERLSQLQTGEMISRFLNEWQHQAHEAGSTDHGHGPELLMGALLQGME
ncbi:amidohydrolase [Alcaligenes aquatilis]|uniref:amidohydrolase n=1 Tax=Alcaligenes aquatilis TaxID=323284 RepID=UPI00361B659B